MTVTRCTISNNFANGDDFAGGGNGGGIGTFRGSVIITSSTISGNSGQYRAPTATQSAAAAAAFLTLDPMIISNCTISGQFSEGEWFLRLMAPTQ